MIAPFADLDGPEGAFSTRFGHVWRRLSLSCGNAKRSASRAQAANREVCLPLEPIHFNSAQFAHNIF